MASCSVMLVLMKISKRINHYQFPWRSRQAFQFLVDGKQFYQSMLDSIADANSFIYLEMYLFESGSVANRFIDAFSAASRRGVKIYLLLDAFGSQGLSSHDRMRLKANHIALEFYNPFNSLRLKHNLFRDHRKLLLVDGLVAFTGGAGLTDEFDEVLHLQLYWHDAMIRIQGHCVADWQTLFEKNWRYSGGLLEYPRCSYTDSIEYLSHGRVLENRFMLRSEVIRSFIKQARTATDYIWVATAYFVPSRKIRRMLCRMSRQGVDVRLLLPGSVSDHSWVRHIGRRYYDRLLRHGVRIFEYQPRFMHMKILLSDQWVSMGSSNIDRWNFKWNLEANQEVRDAAFADIVRRQFEHDFSDSHEIIYKQWSQRPLWVRLNIGMWSIVVRVVSWLNFNRKK